MPIHKGLHHKRGIIYVPGSVYGSDDKYVRFTFARAKIEDIDLGITLFAEALRVIINEENRE